MATDSAEDTADWVELQAILSPNRQYSLEALAREIERSGSTDALPEPQSEEDPQAPDRGVERSRVVAESAFSELENRSSACRGHRDAYPFSLEPGVVRLRDEPGISDYEFLLLLSFSKPTAGHNGTAVLFEELCSSAALGHFGGARNGAKALRFGSPRRPPFAQLCKAVDNLCSLLGEGVSCAVPSADASHTGDSHLDIVAFRRFPDGRAGSLIAFGQCAAGRTTLTTKLSELDCEAFARKWMREPPLVAPLRLFFVPWRTPSARWKFTTLDTGLLFDRCRIVASVEEDQFRRHEPAIRAANAKILSTLRKAA